MRAATPDEQESSGLRGSRLGDVSLARRGGTVLTLRCLDASEPSAAPVPLSRDLSGTPTQDPRASLRWDPDVPRLGIAPLSVHERARLIVTLPRGASLTAHPGRARSLDGAGTTLLVQLDGTAGESVFALRDGDEVVTLPVEVRARWEESFAAVEAMLDDVAAARWSAAVRDAEEAVTRPVSLAPRPRREPHEELLVLRAIAGSAEVDAAVRALARAPVAQLRGAVLPVRAARARDIAPEDLATRAILPGASLPQDLTVRERRAVSTLDVPENRFVRAQLDALLDRAAALSQGRYAEAAAPLRGVFRRWREELSWLDAVAAPTSAAPIALRRSEYQVFAAVASLLDQSAPTRAEAPSAERVTARDTPTLYERWCALEVARALGADELDAAAVMEGGAVEVRWPSGGRARLCAQRRFAGAMPLAFRPDLTVERGAARLHLDAKYRLDPRGQDPSPVRDELVKMHAYRDAIAGSVGAYALFPGAPGDALEGRDARGGVGAIALLPRASREETASQRAHLCEILYALLP